MIHCLIQQRLDPWLRETPRSRIQRLFLTPNNVLRVRVHVQVFFELGPGERIELFDACDVCGFYLFVVAVFVEGSVDLASAEYYAFDFFGGGDVACCMFGIGDYPLEVGFAGEVFDVGSREGVAKEGFGEEHDEC